jgi:sterol desaturase/sphingolipid hydroxylase (fatty acid hydroxylase superfamily)
MSTTDSWANDWIAQVAAFFCAAYHVLLQPHHLTADMPLWSFAATELANRGREMVWFVLIGICLYAWNVRRPGERFSLVSGLRYLLPKSIYGHASFRIDMMALPFQIALNFFVLVGLTVGATSAYGWFLHRFGHSPLAVPDGWISVLLQVLITMEAADFCRFLWHYQGHKVPFFWAFHHGHHSAEVLHPFSVRTHPVDMILRMIYTGGGGGLLAGALMYLFAVAPSPAGTSWTAGIAVLVAALAVFEHNHVRLSFGKTLDRFFYAPCMHQIHHSALPQHQDKNLGLTGGVIFWDWLFGTLYRPTPDEKLVWGSTLQELGENNPHRTLRGFFIGPLKGAAQTLRKPASRISRNTPVPSAGTATPS